MRVNPTIAQIKDHDERKQKKDKALTCLYLLALNMHLENVKLIWDELKEGYEGSDKVKVDRPLTLKREFEMPKMKEDEIVKDYFSNLSQLVNQMRLYGEEVDDVKVLEKVLISLLEIFEAKVTAIEESCNLNELSISKLLSLHA